MRIQVLLLLAALCLSRCGLIGGMHAVHLPWITQREQRNGNMLTCIVPPMTPAQQKAWQEFGTRVNQKTTAGKKSIDARFSPLQRKRMIAELAAGNDAVYSQAKRQVSQKVNWQSNNDLSMLLKGHMLDRFQHQHRLSNGEYRALVMEAGKPLGVWNESPGLSGIRANP